LLEIGHSHRRAVLIMYYWSALVAFAAVGVGLLPPELVLSVLGGGVALAGGTAVVPRVGRRLRARRRRADSRRAARQAAPLTRGYVPDQGKRVTGGL
jgi:UDP-GlcNAc:undecaprenyl-phosphate GlcNAc-1-phosphate transferase